MHKALLLASPSGSIEGTGTLIIKNYTNYVSAGTYTAIDAKGKSQSFYLSYRGTNTLEVSFPVKLPRVFSAGMGALHPVTYGWYEYTTSYVIIHIDEGRTTATLTLSDDDAG